MTSIFVHIPRTGGTSVRTALGIPLRAHEHVTPEHVAGPCAPTARKFCVIRNPFDRAVSLCAFSRRMSLEAEGRALAPAEFRTWLAGGMREPEGGEPVAYAGTRFAVLVTAPQVTWATGCDDVLRFEDLERELWMRFGARLPHENGSCRSTDWRDYYDDETAAAVVELYAVDFEALDYEETWSARESA